MMGKRGLLLGGPSIFLLLLCLRPGDASEAAAEPQYLVLVPLLIRTETPENICVQLNHLNESVTLSATLEYAAHNRSLISDVISEKDFFRCIPIELPRLNGTSNPSVLLLTVKVEGQTLAFWSRRRVLVKNVDSLVFVQTDKPIYKPAQEVKFRIVALDEGFHPLNEKFPLVYIQDPKRNRLFQWQDVELNVGLIQLSFPLTSEPALGTYRVVVKKSSGSDVEHTFNVEEYVLPKYEVSVKAPEVITILTEQLEVTICGRYTYGKPVPGQVKMSVCRRYSSPGTRCYGAEGAAACEEFSGEADVHGCLTQLVKTKTFQLKRDGYSMKLDVEGKIKEEGTGVELTGSGTTDITQTLSRLAFEKVDGYFKPGIPFTGQVKLVDGMKEPIANASIEISIPRYEHKKSYTTDGQGGVQFSIDTSNFTENFVIQARYNREHSCYDRNWVTPQHFTADHSVIPFYSPSQSYLHIESISGTASCGHHQPVRVHYILNPAVVKDEKIAFHYLVVSKGVIVRGGTHVLSDHHNKVNGMFPMDLSVNINMAPLARLLLYTILPNGELLADSEDFVVENCFSNKVRLEFTEPTGLPASDTHLHLAAAKGSLCAIHAVDKSVFLLKPEAELSPQTVYNLLPVKNLKGYYYQGWNVEDPDVLNCVPYKKIVVDGITYSPDPYSPATGDSYKVLQDFGLKVFTSTKMHKPESCSDGRVEHFEPYMSHRLAVPEAAMSRMYGGNMLEDYVSEPEPQLETVRSLFPETWIWNLAVVNGEEEPASEQQSGPAKFAQGDVSVPVTIPDSITEWRAGAFCLSTRAGFGLAKTATLQALQPFFLDLTMPYSVVRGEEFILKGTVFTYLPHCIQVRITLDPSADFVASPVEKEEEFYCLCPNQRKTVAWRVTPKSLGHVNFTASAEAIASQERCGNELVETPTRGRKDTVIKPLLVEPEGIEKDVVFSNLHCAGSADGAQTTPVSLKLPSNVVEGSARASFCVLGDILGNAIQNLHQLLRMPYGCGEQNMALFAPNIYIVDYLNHTGQLTEAVKSKAIGYLVAGYQRQLNYKHSDGSYSTFGEHHQEPGNAWLTAFVMESFARASHQIYVEQQHITDAQAWLAVRQKENGCFRTTGTLLNNALKGGVDDELSLSAYVTIALLESSLPVTHSLVRNALFCLETAARAKEVHVYTRALMAYAFALAGKEDQRAEMLRLLDEVAVKEDDGSIHWQRPGKEDNQPDFAFYRPRAPSAEVEMTSYVLLARLTKQPAPAQEDLTKAAHTVQWLSKQQNPTGGFSSTQDTVVALQALALYGALTFSKDSTGTGVALASGENVLKQFQVDSANRLLLQCQALPKVPGDYDIQVTGDGCAYSQTILRYNVQPHQDDAPFALDVHTVPETCTGPEAHQTFDLAINVSYTGKRPVSNMVIIDVKMLSGFIPVKPSVKTLESANKVKRTEVSTNHVLLYLEKVTNATQSFSFTVERDIPVEGLKPAVVKAYDYYETDEYAVTDYNAPCSSDEIKNGNA
ncbi:alpha-2-macroglobulin [Pogona vitticeps]